MKEYWDKDFYSIWYYGGEKYIHFNGYFYNSDGEAKCLEYVGFTAPLIEYLEWNEDEYDFQQESIKQYINDLTDEKAVKNMNTYYNGNPPVEMPLDEINMETPCGDYVDWRD